jgi:hypothetical protein
MVPQMGKFLMLLADFGDWREEQLHIERIWRKDGSGLSRGWDGTDRKGRIGMSGVRTEK